MHRRIPRLLCQSFAPFLLAGVVVAQQQPPATDATSAPAFVLVNVTSTVAQFNYNYFYQPESIRLASGELVSFPVDMACTISAGEMKIGDTLAIGGAQFTSPSGAKVIRAESITNATTHKVLRTESAERDMVKPAGKVTQLNYGTDGQVNGLVLNTGQLVLWKPRPNLSLTVMPGDSVTVEGVTQVSPNGKIVIGAQAINGVAVAAPPVQPPRRIPVDVPLVAVITNTGSTNTLGYRIGVGRGGQANVTVGDRHNSSQIPLMITRRFFKDLNDAKPLGKLAVGKCMKSASFGGSTYVGFGGQQSPDLSCPGDQMSRTLHDDIDEIIKAVNLGDLSRR
jgi:hypothetical protein